MITITDLYIYPLKSLAGIAVSSFQLDALGAEYDRRYMLVDADGQFISQRRFPQLVHIVVADANEHWQLTMPDHDQRLLSKQGRQEQRINVDIWDDTVQAFDQGDDWAEWFGRYLDQPVRLVYITEESQRLIDSRYSPQKRLTSFADGFPLLLCQESSLAMLNQSLENPINMIRFRPNIIVSGAEAFAEDCWQALHNKSMTLDIVKPCSRCVIPTINPQTAAKEPTVWQALSQLRKAEDGHVYFGQNVIHREHGRLAIGDTFSVK